MIKHTNIITYNSDNASSAEKRPFFDRADPKQIQVIAMQEPGWIAGRKTTLTPRGFWAAHNQREDTRVCFLVSQELDVGTWTFRQKAPFLAVLTLWPSSTAPRENTPAEMRRDEANLEWPSPSPENRGPPALHIVNVYAHPNDPFEPVQWAILEELTNLEGEVIILGDFNAHHPNWGGTQIRADARGTIIAHTMLAAGLEQLTPQGEITYRKAGSETVIDLVFATQDTAARMLQCKPREDWAAISDHIPILITIDRTPPEPVRSRRWALHSLDTPAFRQTVRQSGWHESDDPLVSLQTVIQ